jgi:putative ABC transporter, ATP-binding protein
MAKRLTDNINSQYFEAINKMTPKKARRRIVVYVESYDDVFFWRSVLGRYEDDKLTFDIMLPSRNQHLDRGKKAAISNMLKGVGRDMIACVDADYDYILQGATEMSRQMLENPYIFHTYAYAIENFQCYAKGLHETCVMVTLNDHRIFNFERFLQSYSQTIWPLFVWHVVFLQRRKMTMHFDMCEFNKVVVLPSVRIQNPKWAIEYLSKKVRAKMFQLERRFPKLKDVLPETERMLRDLGINDNNTYLYIQGHHLFDLVVSPVVQTVCDILRNEQENDIRDRAVHSEQARTEIACYENSLGKVKMMMKKNTYYQFSPEFQKILADVEKYLEKDF